MIIFYGYFRFQNDFPFMPICFNMDMYGMMFIGIEEEPKSEDT